MRSTHLFRTIGIVLTVLLVLIPALPSVRAFSPLHSTTQFQCNGTASPTGGSLIETAGDIIVFVFHGVAASDATGLTDSAGNTYTSRIDNGPSGAREHVFTAIASTTVSLSFTVTLGGASSYCNFDASSWTGPTGIGATVGDSSSAPGNSGSDTLAITTSTQAATIVEGLGMDNGVGTGCYAIAYASGQTDVASASCITSTFTSHNARYGFSASNSVGVHSYSMTWSGGTSTNGQAMSHWALELLMPVTGLPPQNSQCYGNCASLVNTNSTHTTNFNNSLTLFYATQSNLNGFVANVSTNLARSYTDGMILYLGLYRVDPGCTATLQPFTSQCPGFLAVSSQTLNPSKGLQFLLTSVSVTAGQWIGVAVSGSFKGLDINDTTTAVTLYQAAGTMPGQISQYSNLGPQKPSLFAWIIGTPPGGSGGTVGGGANGCSLGLLPCMITSLQVAMGGGIFGGLSAFGIIFGLSVGGFLLLDYAIMAQINRNRVQPIQVKPVLGEGIIVFLGVIELIAFSVIGVLPAWIPLLFFAIFAWLLGQTIWSHKASGGSGGMA